MGPREATPASQGYARPCPPTGCELSHLIHHKSKKRPDMSMTKRLWSLNALATELGYDRRTVGLALNDIQPDGKLKGHPAWYLDTALVAVQQTARRTRPVKPLKRIDVFAGSLTDRVENWQEIYAGSARSERKKGWLDVSATAACLSVQGDDVLTWLRAGCPYAAEGNWADGDGFKLELSWVSEWASLVLSRLVAAGDQATLRTVRLAPLLGTLKFRDKRYPAERGA